MTRVLSVISFKTDRWYWRDWSAMILKSYLSIYLFPCLQHWTQALDLGIWAVRSLKQFFILGTWLLEQALSCSALWALPDPQCPLFLITKIQTLVGGYVNNKMKEKWSPLYSRDHLLAKLPLFHMQAVSSGQRGLQCWTVWPGLPICHGERRCAFSGPPGFYVLCQPARLPLWSRLCGWPSCQVGVFRGQGWFFISPPPGAAGVSGTATHLGWDPHQLWAIFPTFGCERRFRPAGTGGEMRGQA